MLQTIGWLWLLVVDAFDSMLCQSQMFGQQGAK
jgi:hypothetical protein